MRCPKAIAYLACAWLFLALGCASTPHHAQPKLAPGAANPLSPAQSAPAPVMSDLRIPAAPGQSVAERMEKDPPLVLARAAAPQAIPDESPGRAPAVITPLTTQSTESPDLSDPGGELKLRMLHRRAADAYAVMDSYIVRLHRREQVNGKDKPEEVMLFKFRKQPWSVYFKWLGTEGKGREVIYVKGHYEDKIHTLLAAGDMPFAPAGKRVALSPDSFLVRSSSRHSIQEAGVGMLIENFGRLLGAAVPEDSRQGKVRYLGIIKRPEFEQAGEAAEQLIPPGAEPLLARGGRRLWWFDPSTRLPALLITEDETGHQVEYYCYDRFQFPVRLDPDDFNPEKLWSQKH